MKRYLELNPKTRPASLVGLMASTIYEAVSKDAQLVSAGSNGNG